MSLSGKINSVISILFRRKIKELNRILVINSIIENKKNNRTYLEIGIFSGKCFLQIRAKRKIGLDPCITTRLRLMRIVLFFRDLFTTKYFAKTSDAFFTENSSLFNKYKIDVAFIDGLHTYKQSVIDVRNVLKYLNDDGIIVMHDCNPENEAAAYPALSRQQAEQLNLPRWTGSWNGDVWKSIIELRSTENNLKIFVLDCDWGLGIITRGKPEKMLDFSLADFERMTYKDLENNRLDWLNLKPAEYIREFANGLK